MGIGAEGPSACGWPTGRRLRARRPLSPLLLAGSAERALVLEAEPEGPGAAQFH